MFREGTHMSNGIEKQTRNIQLAKISADHFCAAGIGCAVIAFLYVN
jgi:hypothetical protein